MIPRFVSLHRSIRAQMLAFCGMSASAFAVPNVQTFIIPFPEADFQASLKAIDITGTPVGNQMKTIISMVVPTTGTIVRYDQWEDGYEADLNAPVQATTLIWGDGNTSNGTAPGYPTDVFPAGATVNLNNNVVLPRAAGTLFYDGRDRIGCTAAIAVTRAGWGIAPGTVLASATEVYDTRRYGTSYKIPIGITTGSVQNFEYSSLHIIAAQDNTTVQVDVDGNGTVDQTKVINLGESMLVNGGVKAGATVAATKPVQVHELTGDVGSSYESRTFAIRPTSLWGSSYFAPVGTTLSIEVHTVFLYNPNASPINVSYETTTGIGTLSVAANGNSQFAMPMNSGGHFFTAGGEAFYAVGANDSGAAAAANQTHDWGYALVPESYLTTGVVIGFGPGSDDLAAPAGPDQNGSPVWITPATSTTIYVNYSGDFASGPSTAPNGSKYDVSYNVGKLQSQTIYDPNDKDMTKARIFTTDGSKIAAAWGEDPSKAGSGAPFLDMGTTIVPFPQPALSKASALVVDVNTNGKTDVGDTIEYTVRVANEGVVDLDNTIVLDALPATVTYVPGSTKVNGALITDNNSPSTFFPVDENGYTLVSIPPGGFTNVTYRVTVNPGATSVINHATANGGSVSAPLTASTTVPVVPSGGVAPTTITFSDSAGTPLASYPPNGNVYVTVTNIDLNTNSATVQTITVTVTDPITGDQELITLTETGVNTGIFRNSSPLPSSTTGGLTQQDGTLYALQGNPLTATFVNTQFGGTFTANAVILTSTQTKKLYLTDTLALDRINPAAVPVDSTTASTSVMGTGASTIAALGTVSSAESASTVGSLTFSHTVASGTDRLLVVSASMGKSGGLGTEAISTVTFGGVGLTRAVGFTDASGPKARTEIWYLVNPSQSTGNVVITLGASQALNIMAGATTFSGVDQASPIRGFGTAGGSSTAPSVGVTSAVGDMVYASMDADDRTAAQILQAAGQTLQWERQSPPSGTAETGGSATTKAGAVGTVTSSWTITSDIWAAAAVSIKPSTGGSSTVSFTQTPTFATAFTMPSGAVPSAGIYYTVASGSMPASPIITATLKKGATLIATSSGVSSSGGLLSFTFPALLSAANFAIGDSVTLDITSTQSGVTFTVDYDSSTKPSVINLPTTTVIAINSFGLYDAAYPAGNLVTNVTNGQRVYARVTASDPFGAYDITSLDLGITDPANATGTVNLTSTVASTTSSKTFEYSWLAGPNDGGYTIQATAKEGSEGIAAVSSLPLQVTSLDLGTPSITTFTDSSGNTVPSYTTSGPVYVQVVDRDQNTNAAVAETVTVVVTTSNGDRETITLTETGVSTGIFRSAAITTNTSAVTQNNSTLNVVAGASLAANYVDSTDPADTSSASAIISSPSASAVASVFKSLISPTNGKALVGGTVSYNITVTNPGTVNLATVGLSDAFPSANLQFVSASITPTTTGSGSLSWTNVGPLSAGQSVSLTVNFNALAAGATVNNSASVSGTATAGPSTASVTIEKPGVTVTKTLLTPAAGPVYLGDTVVWRIVIQNSGSTNLTTVPLSDNYSGGALTYVSATTAPDSVGTGSLLWNNIGPIAAAATKTIDVTMTVKGTSNPTTNIADVSYAVDASGNSVSPSVSSASVQTIGGSIGSTIFKDMNNNGAFDSGEGVQNVYVYSDANGNGIREVGEPFGITDYYGAYSIYNLPVAAGGTTYNIKVDATTLPAGLTTVVVDPDAAKNGQTSITLTRAALDNTTANFGYRGTASIGDTVWLDVNGDGVLDATDHRISGVKVFVDQNNNGVVDANEPSAITNSNGNYIISNLPDFTWTVAIDATTLPAGVVPTYDLNGIATAHKASVVLAAGQVRTDVDFGYQGNATVTGHLYIDTNGNGSQDSGEPDLANVDVLITDSLGNPQTAATNTSGNWTAAVTPGTTIADVQESDPQYPAGYVRTEGNDPTTFTAVAGVSINGGTDGYFLPGSISGSVFADTDGDGDADASLENVILRLLNNLGNPVLDGSNQPVTALTIASGSYGFGNLPPGNYRVVQVQPSNYNSVSDTDGGNDNLIGNQTPITVSPGNNSGGNNFIEIELGVISGYVLLDTDNNGSGDAPLSGVVLNFLNGAGSPVLDGLGAPIQVASGADGFYRFTLVPVGNYRVSQNQPVTYGSVSDVDGANNNVIGDETPIIMIPGLIVTHRNFVEIRFGSIAGMVLNDTNHDGSGDSPLANVTVTLLDGSGNPVDGDPDTTGVQPVTRVTDVDGGYFFGSLFPGSYQIVETQPSGYGSVSDVDGGNLNRIGNTIVAPGQTVTGRYFVEIQLGAISGYVTANGNPLSNTTLTLLDTSGEPVDGDPDAPGIQRITTVTDSNGFYIFPGVMPGSYQIVQTQPDYYNSLGDADGGDLDIIGDQTLITVLPGQTNVANNFIESIDPCSDTWAEWKFVHPGEEAEGNSDGDAYDNLDEFAFAMPADSGAGNAWIVRPHTAAGNVVTIEGVFTRPKGAYQNVVYSLEYVDSLANPIIWASIEVPAEPMISVVDNGDCTETVTIHDLEFLTSMQNGKGFVRIRADLDEDNDETVDHTSYTEVEGWNETELELSCRTYNNPFLRETTFTGTVGTVSGQDLGFNNSAGTVDLATLLAPGVSYYLEVTSGDNEGHRFDITSAAGSSVTLAIDSVINSGTPPFNTLAGALPANLTGDQIIIRRYRTLDEMFQPSGFGATGSQTSADQVQIFAESAWTTYWLYDNSGTPQWVKSGDGLMADQGSTVIPPGQGTFLTNRTAVTSILSYGEVRENDFIRPLAIGTNLVGGGYPLDQAPTGMDTRAMNLGTGFFGSRDFKTADSIFVWNADTTIGAPGYSTYYLLSNNPTLPTVVKWVKVSDASLLNRDSEVLLLGNRSTFIRTKNAIPSYTTPRPWTP